jgi:hypothetical protein
VFDDPDNMFDSRAEESSLVPEQVSRNDFQHTLDVWARQGSGIGSDEKCSRIWSPPSGSSAILGGLPILLFLGDFKQFEPVRDTPLWKDHGAKAIKDEKLALQIWRQVKDVIFLTEQMTTGRDPSVLQFTVTKRFGCLWAVMTAHCAAVFKGTSQSGLCCPEATTVRSRVPVSSSIPRECPE